MNRKLKIILSITIIGIIAFVGWSKYQRYQTKQFSPADRAVYQNNYIDIKVDYCRPHKNGREIFGKLVPYGRWWRTGANEPTQITLSRDIAFSDKVLKAGLYSVVTIPEKDEWTIIFNNRIPEWGTYYYPKDDELRIQASVEELPEVVEQLTIDFTESDGQPTLIIAWDQVKVAAPFTIL